MKTPTSLLSLCALASVVAAQSPEVVIPRIANGIEGNDLASYPFGRSGFRTQQLIDETAIATSGGAILGIGYRADNDNSIGSQAVTIQNLSIELSQSSVAPAGMSTVFAQNITAAPVQVFAGSLSLPAYASAPGQHAPWVDVPLAVPFPLSIGSGNLLIDITAANAGGTSTGFVMDSALPGGAVSWVGSGGALSQPDAVRTTISGSGSMGRMSGIVPGGQFSILVQSQFQSWSGALMLGFQKLPVPFDLSVVGAPGNEVHIDPADSYPFTLGLPPIGFGYRSSWNLAVPANPNLTGASLFLQSWVADPAANALGVVTANAIQVTIGDAALHPLRQVNASDFTASVGTYQYTSGIFGGAVVRLSGGFQ